MKRVLTYGTFDLLHYGHIRLLQRAKALGDYLIVALSTDEFNEIKGKKAYHNYETRKSRNLFVGLPDVRLRAEGGRRGTDRRGLYGGLGTILVLPDEKKLH